MKLRSAWLLPFFALVGACATASSGGDHRPSGEVSAKPPETAAATAGAVASGAPIAKGPAWEPEKTYAIVIGVLTFQNPAVTSFSDRHRKDQELAELLQKRGVPKDHVVMLLDKDATAAASFAAVEKMAKTAPPGSTLLFYYAGHGGKDEKGDVAFLAFDDDAKHRDTSLRLAKVQALIEAGFKGSNVLLMADCCHSGGLSTVAANLRAKGFAAASITSAEASNLSTGNWTFSQTVIDALDGRPLFDRNGDGSIDLGELSDETRDAMKYRENQRHGVAFEGIDRSFVLATDSGPAVKHGAGTAAVASYVRAKHDGKVDIARILGKSGGNATVELYDYSDASTAEVPVKALEPIEWGHFAVGSKIHVFWEGKAYPAEVTKAEGDFEFITYTGYPSYWDEWVLSDRISETPSDLHDDAPDPGAKYAKGDKIEVEWKGKWWPASVIGVEGAGRYRIHYDGYGPEWDEVVRPGRMRKK